MNLPLPKLRLGLTRLARRATFIALIFGVLFDVWLFWQGLEQWIERPLASDRVSAKQLRVSESQRQTFISNITAYQQPPALPAIPKITFKNESSN